MIDPTSLKDSYVELRHVIILQIQSNAKMYELLRTEEGIEKLYHHFKSYAQRADSLEELKRRFRNCFKKDKDGLYTTDAARVIVSKVGVAYYGSMIVLMERDVSNLPTYLGNKSMAPMASFRLEVNL